MKEQRMRFDDLFAYLGEFGRYQKIIYYLICIPFIFAACQKLVWVFLGATPLYRCVVPFIDDDASPTYHVRADLLNESIPWDDKNQRWSQCEMYDDEDGFQEKRVVPCSRTVYDRSQYTSTIVTEFNLVCNYNWQRALIHSCYAMGEMIGALVTGSASDKIGRRRVLVVCFFGITVFGTALGLVTDYTVFLLLRMVIGIFTQGIINVCFVLSLEFVGPSKRSFVGIICNYFFATGYVSVAALAYLIREWQYLQIAISVPAVILCIGVRWVPESARWLISVDRKEEALEIIRRAAKINEKELPPFELESEKKDEKIGKNVNPLDLIRNSTVRKRLFVVNYCWLVNSAVYYGLSLNTSNLGGNDYVNFLIAALVEFPAYTMCLITLRFFGRRHIICACMVMGGLCLTSTLVIPIEMNTLVIVMAMLGKFGITASYAVAFLIAGELYPTGLRNAAIGINSTCSRIGSIITSFIVLLAEYWRPLPLIILGTMSISAGLLTLLLPETRGKALPDTLKDLEKFSELNGKTKPVENGEANEMLPVDEKTSL